MSIKETLEKIKPFYPLFLIIVLMSIFFALGRISVINQEKEPIKIEYGSEALVFLNSQNTSTSSLRSHQGERLVSTTTKTIKTDGEVVGSKSGKKYYFPWCGTVKRIKIENQVHFASIKEAKEAGFTPGGNCKGLI